MDMSGLAMGLAARLAALPDYKIVTFEGVTDDCNRLGDVLFYVPLHVDVTDMDEDEVADRAMLTVWHYVRTITPDTDLAPLVGVRVRIERTVHGKRYTYLGVFKSLWHPADLANPLSTDGAGGMLREEPHGTCRGGVTGFHLPYHDTTVEILRETP